MNSDLVHISFRIMNHAPSKWTLILHSSMSMCQCITRKNARHHQSLMPHPFPPLATVLWRNQPRCCYIDVVTNDLAQNAGQLPNLHFAEWFHRWYDGQVDAEIPSGEKISFQILPTKEVVDACIQNHLQYTRDDQRIYQFFVTTLAYL